MEQDNPPGLIKDSDGPHRRTAPVASELGCFKVDIAALRERPGSWMKDPERKKERATPSSEKVNCLMGNISGGIGKKSRLHSYQA
ncbi:unnamed protein product [Lota lota]